MEIVTSRDVEIVAMLKNRDQQAMDTILERYGDQLYGFIYQQLHSEELASDALKDTFSLIWETSSTYNKNPEHFFIWLLRMAKQASEQVQHFQLQTA